jgi:hypothetical protein
MEFQKLVDIIFKEIKPKLQNNQGLAVFAKERAKFEGWLKVEICDILSGHVSDVIPEKNRTDITFGNWAIELKTVNTNYRFQNVVNKIRPITMNTQGVVEDIQKLKTSTYLKKAICFVAFPVTHDNEDWQIQLKRISRLLKEIHHIPFQFKGGIPGVIYMGLL